MVVTAGETEGFAKAETNPAGTELHAYVLPPTAAAPSVVLDPTHIERLAPATAAGNALTVIVIVLGVLGPHPFTAVTDKSPPVATALNATETELPAPIGVIVAPDPV